LETQLDTFNKLENSITNLVQLSI